MYYNISINRIDEINLTCRKIFFNHNLGYQITWRKPTQKRPQTQFPTIILYHGQLKIITNNQIILMKETLLEFVIRQKRKE